MRLLALRFLPALLPALLLPAAGRAQSSLGASYGAPPVPAPVPYAPSTPARPILREPERPTPVASPAPERRTTEERRANEERRSGTHRTEERRAGERSTGERITGERRAGERQGSERQGSERQGGKAAARERPAAERGAAAARNQPRDAGHHPTATPAASGKPVQTARPGAAPAARRPDTATRNAAARAPAVPAPAPAPEPAPPAQPAEPRVGSVTGLPLPRFAALRSDAVNLRAGPGLNYPIQWTYQRQELPVQILREFDVWRRIRDSDGTEGWVRQTNLTGRRSFLVRGEEKSMFRRAEDGAAVVARLKPGVVGRLRICEAGSTWCEAQVGNIRGFIRRSDVWGLEPGEVVQ